jgi:hypothetical protein
MNTTRIFNLNNWTGEEVTVDYTDEGSFEFYGYTFQIGQLEDDGLVEAGAMNEGEGWRALHGDDWSDPLTTLFFIGEDGRDLERAVIQAVRYIAMHV